MSIAKQCFAIALLLPAVIITPVAAKSVAVSSPDKALVVTISDDGGLHYKVDYQQQPVLLRSEMGLSFRDQSDFGPGYRIRQHQQSSHHSDWQQPWGERRTVVDQHNELVVTLDSELPHTRPYRVRVRVFNDGLGFRYEGVTHNETAAITGELTGFTVANPEGATAWWVPALRWNRYEYLYNTTPVPAITHATTPLTMRNANGVHLSIHEAALVDFAEMTVKQSRSGFLSAELTPRSDGLKVLTQSDFVTPWRTIQVADSATGLLNSSMILNLNEPNALGDVSWVEPGKYAGIWWGMHLGVNTWGSGEHHGATTDNTKAVMDFAAQSGFDGVLVEGWNIGWDGSWFHNGDVFSFTQSYPDFDIAEVSAYGKQKGVRLIGHHETSGSVSNYEHQMEDAFRLYQQHGVRQVKTGYVADGGTIKRIDDRGIVRHEWHGSQFMVNHYLNNVKTAAKYQISINTHEPIKDTGLRRTYPNWLSREGARGQEFNAWGSPPNDPQHTVNLVYTRMLAGPMDFTPGIFNLAYEGLDAENRVQTTLAKQLALYVVLYSPIQMAADLPEHYDAHPEAFQFIKDVPTDWEESIALQGEVGDFVVFARQARDSDDWYLGAITDEQARQLQVPLDFLPPGKSFQAQLYLDGENADWLTQPYDMQISRQTVSASDTLTLPLATSGGAAVRFVAIDNES
ncbi:glycoside hydrolase family 97 protein [Aestuariibacter halophilus]|uniref:Glycoside hydrolase family 97 protein n=1 Tax=Fluctibacter halophilus TaxID=226011 RepID=A0ABS8G8F7_9ALTE|nr:glycoside hydrolase family 97 protein [Aestuariibacter halophilus]MCC2615496.1 glycoside hydrolase family 97 protein [Aestuariibacter halophilus]